MQHFYSGKHKLVLEKLGEIIKEERAKQYTSLRLFAYEFGLQPSLLSRIENGNNQPKLLSTLAICEALNIKPSEIFKKLEESLPDGFSLLDE